MGRDSVVGEAGRTVAIAEGGYFGMRSRRSRSSSISIARVPLHASNSVRSSGCVWQGRRMVNFPYTNARRWGTSLGSLAIGLALFQSAPVAAQEATTAPPQDPATSASTTQADANSADAAADAKSADDQAKNEIVVIGTGTNISGVKPVGSEAVTISQ